MSKADASLRSVTKLIALGSMVAWLAGCRIGDDTGNKPSTEPATGVGPSVLLFQGQSALADGVKWDFESGNKRTAIGQINPAFFSPKTSPLHEPGTRIGLNLFEKTSLVAVVDKVSELDGGAFNATGHVEGVEGSSFIAATTDGAISVLASAPGQGTFRVELTPDGKYRAVEQSDFQPSCPPIPSMPVLPPDPPRKAAASAAAATSTVEIDIAVFYTSKALTAIGGESAMNTNINLMVAEANQAYVNSAVNVHLNLVYKGPVVYTESGNITTDLSRLASTTDAYLPTVHSIRQAYGADIVTLMTESGGTLYAGLGYVLAAPVSSAFKAYAFNVVRRQWSVGQNVLVHEIGHNMGCLHDPANAVGGVGAYSYSWGYRFTGTDGIVYRDIMAYAPGTQVSYFSNPDITLHGVAIGVAGHNDNALTLNNTAATVAAFMGPNEAPEVSITSVDDGATFAGPTTIILKSLATDDGGVSKVEYYNGTTLLGSSSVSPYTYAWKNVAVGSYTVTAKAYDVANTSTTSEDVGLTVGASALPSGWSESFIGTDGITGTAEESGGTYTINAGAAGVAGKADGIHFAYKSINGMGMVDAEVTSVENTSADATAGVMLRDTNSVGGRCVYLAVKPGGGLVLFKRTALNGPAAVASLGTVSFPIWLKLVRKMTDFAAYKSTDGNNWTLVGSVPVIMPTAIKGGLAVASKVVDAENTSTFAHVLVTDGTAMNPPQISLSGTTPGPTITPGTAIPLSATVTDRDGPTSSSITRVEFYNGDSLLNTDMTTPYLYTWTATAGNATLRAKVLDAQGVSTYSNSIALSVEDTGVVAAVAQADSYVRNGSFSGNNYGTASTAFVRAGTDGNTYYTYMKFSIAGVPSVSHATLRFYGNLSAAGSMTVGVYSVTDTTWKESGTGAITFTNKPGAGAGGSVTVASTTPAWYEVDMTSFVQAQKTAGATALSFSLRGNSGATTYSTVIYTKQAAFGKPELVLTP